MAWTDQCKIAFTTTADALYYQQQGRKNKTAILKRLAEDTGVPQKTLRRWWYENNSTKNGITGTRNGNNNKNQSQTIDTMCEKCHERPKKEVIRNNKKSFQCVQNSLMKGKPFPLLASLSVQQKICYLLILMLK